MSCVPLRSVAIDGGLKKIYFMTFGMYLTKLESWNFETPESVIKSIVVAENHGFPNFLIPIDASRQTSGISQVCATPSFPYL